ncbi:FxLD family lanthipeptide [Streptomyces sp. RTd22]|uniref:FxLD family lanthipeptide n=1 Tax=Streptomyces sp. RTd22 TaxID=1841249 RepID=UPI0007C4E42F|nr:FxLD family lanthipeptide [Streptomyces sp. RTd22]
MSASTVQDKAQVRDIPEVVSGAVQDPFDLDVDVLELAGGTVPLITLTDDGCKPSCPASCATNVA